MLSFETHALCLSLAPKHQDHTAQRRLQIISVRKEAEELFASDIKPATLASRQLKENYCL